MEIALNASSSDESDCNILNSRNIFKLFLAAILAIVVLFSVFQIVYGEHAVERHGSTAEEVRKCISDKGALKILHNPATNRNANICQIGETLFGVMITEGDKEVTSFEKEKMKTLDKVIQYLNNVGYIQ